MSGGRFNRDKLLNRSQVGRDAATTIRIAPSEMSDSCAGGDGELVFYQETEAEEIIRMSEFGGS